jgi:hypothetical protein
MKEDIFFSGEIYHSVSDRINFTNWAFLTIAKQRIKHTRFVQTCKITSTRT